MYQDAFKKLKDKEVAKLLDKLNPLFEGTPFEASETTIMAQATSFYKDMRYLDVADYSCVPPSRRFVLEGKGHDIVLDWSNEPIYALNKDLPITLNEDNVADYVRFFFNHVRGQNGRFLITENVDDIKWREDPPPAARKSIGKMLLPVTLREQSKSGTYHLPVTVMFKDSLFQCDVNVSPEGEVTLDNEELLVEDMPVLDDSFGQ